MTASEESGDASKAAAAARMVSNRVLVRVFIEWKRLDGLDKLDVDALAGMVAQGLSGGEAQAIVAAGEFF